MVGIDCDAHYWSQARCAAGQFGLETQVRFRQLQVYDLAREQEEFDMVLFMGVLYHLRYPLLGPDIVAGMVKRLLPSCVRTWNREEYLSATGAGNRTKEVDK